MKKIISTIIAIAMIMTMVNIPVVINADETSAPAEVNLVNITDDYSSYTTDTALDGWYLVKKGTTATFGAVDGGVELRQVDPIPLLNGKKNGEFSPYYNRIYNEKVVDAENGTVLTLEKMQGSYDIIIDYSYKLNTHEPVDGFTFGGEYFGMYIGSANKNDHYLVGDSSVLLNLRFRSGNLYVANTTSDSTNTMVPKSISYTDNSVENHRLTVSVDTATKEASVMVDGNTNKISVGKFWNQNLDSFNVISICAMERLGKDSYLRIEKVQIIEKETDASVATHALVDSLPAKLADDISAVTEDIELLNADGITWSSSDESVISNTGKVTRSLEGDKEVTLTATVDLGNNGGVYTKAYTMTVTKAEPVVIPPATLYGFEEDYTTYTSDAQLINWLTYTVPGKDDNGNAISSLGIVNGEGYKMAQQYPKILKSATAQNGNFSPEIHKTLGSVTEDALNRTVLKQTKLQGKYEMEVDYAAKVINLTLEDGKALGYTGSSWNTAYYYMTLAGLESPGISDTSITTNGIADFRIKENVINCTYALKDVDGYEKDRTLGFDGNVEDHSLKFVIDTAERQVIAELDSDEKFIVPFVSSADYFNTLSIKGMERLANGSYFTLKRLKLSQIETDEAKATLEVVNQLPEGLVANPSEVTENFTMPAAMDGVRWTSSDEATVSLDGVVTRGTEDKEVVITAIVDLKNNGGVYTKEYTLTVPKSEAPSGGDEGGDDPVVPPVEDNSDLITVYEDFSQYSDISQIPYLAYSNDSHASVKAVKGEGIVIRQHTSTPLSGTQANSTQAPHVAHAVAGTFKADAENRTTYRIDRFAGKYRITMEFKARSEAYPDNKYDGVSVSQPYYNFRIGSVANLENMSTTITESGLFFRVLTKRATALNSSSSSSNTMTPSALYYNANQLHTMVMDVDTETRETSVDIDAKGNPAKGTIVKKGYLNAIAVSGFQRMLVDSEFVIKSIKFEQLEADALTTEALDALAALPDSLVADPYAVTENIVLPEAENITWSISDTSIVGLDGTINRWYDDRDVVITATFSKESMLIYRDYTITVKAFDDYYSKNVMNKAGSELADFVPSGNINTAKITVSDNGVEFEKTTKGADVEGEKPVYYANYLLYGEEVAYNDATKSSLWATGLDGTYDVEYTVTPSVSGNKPVYVALGSGDVDMAALRIAKDGIQVSTADVLYDAISEDTTGKTYNVRLRVNTDEEKVWVFIDGKMVGTYFKYQDVDFADTLRVIIDENNAKGDKIVINNIKVTELVRNDVEVKNELVSALDKLTVANITATPDSVESIKTLPSTVGEYDVVWTSNSNLIDTEKFAVYHGENDETVIVSAIINNNGVYAKKEFTLNVRAATENNEQLDYYLSDIAETITKQNANDIRYDINLPVQHNGLSIVWTSSKPEILGADGKINTSVAITEPTEVILTAKITFNGITSDRTYKYTVSPRAYSYDVYSAEGGFDSITVNGVENVAVTYNAYTNIEFVPNGEGKITFADKSGKNIIEVNVSDGAYGISYKDNRTADYAVSNGETVKLSVFTMPDIDRVAVWANGAKIVDFGETIDKITDISSVKAEGEVAITSADIVTDEYGVLDINLNNIGYFDAFAKNVVKDDVSMVTDTIIPAKVAWTSSNTDLFANDGKVTNPDSYSFADITLTLTSNTDSSVVRKVTKKVAVACPEERNLALNAPVNTSVSEKPGYVKGYLTDGKLDTAYATSYTNKKPALTIDLGEMKYFNTIYVNEDFTKYEKSLKAYSIAYSTDGETWVDVKTGTISGIESTVIGFDTVYARYVKFVADECYEKDLYLNELEVYLSVSSYELMKLDVDAIDLGIGATVKEDLTLPLEGDFGTNFVWSSSHPEVISTTGKVTRQDESVTVILTVTAQFEGQSYSREFAAYVPSKSTSGAKPVGGSGGSGGGGGGGAGAGTGTSTLPGYVETDVKEEVKVEEEPVVTTNTFADLPESHWAYENVMKLKELGVIDGVGDNKFNPSGIVTREQFLKMLVEATATPDSANAVKFADVDSSAWYAPYVAAGVDAGLINGITDDTFGVGSEIKRQDMAVMIARILNGKNIPVTQTAEVFDDDNSISGYAKDAVYKVRDAGIINGYNNNQFSPATSLTRAEAATVIIKLLNVLQ